MHISSNTERRANGIGALHFGDLSFVSMGLALFLASPPGLTEAQERIASRASPTSSSNGSSLATSLTTPSSVVTHSELEPLRLFRLAQALSPRERESGEEMRVALAISEGLSASYSTRSPLPTLHLIQMLVDANPKGFALSSAVSGKEGASEHELRQSIALRELWVACDSFLAQERGKMGDRVLLTPHSRSILVFHEDRNFVPGVLKLDLRELIGPRSTEIKARSAAMDFIQPFGAEVTKEETQFVADVYRRGTSEPKSELAEALALATKNTDTKCLVWIMAHGDKDGIRLFDSVGEQKSPVDSRMAEGRITADLLADMLLAPHLEEESGACDLEHIFLVLDACYQYRFATDLHSALIRKSEEAGRALTTFPTVVVASQRDTPANYGMARVSIPQLFGPPGESDTPASYVEVGDAFSSALARGIGGIPGDFRSLRLTDICAVTDGIRELYTVQVREPNRRVLTGGSIFDPGRVWGPEELPLSTQAPAIFSPLPVTLREVALSIATHVTDAELSAALSDLKNARTGRSFALELY